MYNFTYKTVVFIAIFAVILILGLMFGMPMYNVWQQDRWWKRKNSSLTDSPLLHLLRILYFCRQI